jgi:hypothetical protein
MPGPSFVSSGRRSGPYGDLGQDSRLGLCGGVCRVIDVSPSAAREQLRLYMRRAEGVCKNRKVIWAAGRRNTNEPTTHIMTAPRT